MYATAAAECRKGEMCNEFAFVPNSGRVAYRSKWWTWGGSPIQAEDGTFHMYVFLKIENSIFRSLRSHSNALEDTAGKLCIV